MAAPSTVMAGPNQESSLRKLSHDALAGCAGLGLCQSADTAKCTGLPATEPASTRMVQFDCQGWVPVHATRRSQETSGVQTGAALINLAMSSSASAKRA